MPIISEYFAASNLSMNVYVILSPHYFDLLIKIDGDGDGDGDGNGDGDGGDDDNWCWS